MEHQIRIGPAGWSYKDWEGTVYPQKPGKNFDPLEYLARFFNTIEINSSGQIVLTFKSSITTYKNARCYFNKSQSARVAALNAHVEATVEGTVKGLGDGFDNSKAYLVLESCTVP